MDYCCRYSENEIHFNLMALISDRRVQYEKRIAELTKTVEVSSVLSVLSCCNDAKDFVCDLW
jgi:hypothetical protein